MNQAFYADELCIHQALDSSSLQSFPTTVSMMIDPLLLMLRHTNEVGNPTFTNILNMCQVLQNAIETMNQSWNMINTANQCPTRRE